MLQFIRAGRVRHVVTYKLDRLGRSLTQLAIMVSEFQTRNVGLICTSQGIDTSTPNPVAQLQLGVLIDPRRANPAKAQLRPGLAPPIMGGRALCLDVPPYGR
jgi:Resolvase, N terminal domain